MSDPPVCDHCAGAMFHAGRISLPPKTIFECSSCGKQSWVAEAPPSYRPHPPQPVNQPQAQQQQQPQPESQSVSDEMTTRGGYNQDFAVLSSLPPTAHFS